MSGETAALALLGAWAAALLAVHLRPSLERRLRWVRPLVPLARPRLFSGRSMELRILYRDVAEATGDGEWVEAALPRSLRVPLIWHPALWEHGQVAGAARRLVLAEPHKRAQEAGPRAEARAILAAFVRHQPDDGTRDAREYRVQRLSEAGGWLETGVGSRLSGSGGRP